LPSSVADTTFAFADANRNAVGPSRSWPASASLTEMARSNVSDAFARAGPRISSLPVIWPDSSAFGSSSESPNTIASVAAARHASSRSTVSAIARFESARPSGSSCSAPTWSANVMVSPLVVTRTRSCASASRAAHSGSIASVTVPSSAIVVSLHTSSAGMV
jgi:hypothetical protein